VKIHRNFLRPLKSVDGGLPMTFCLILPVVLDFAGPEQARMLQSVIDHSGSMIVIAIVRMETIYI
jgi:hypothetical protein